MIPANKIIDEYTDLPVSRQRKWQLRHPEKQKVIKDRYNRSDKGKEYKKQWFERRKRDTSTELSK